MLFLAHWSDGDFSLSEYKEYDFILMQMIEAGQLDLNKDGELRDILRDWREKNPTAGLVITGNKVLERGLTFLTDGFCFDYMILSAYFSRKLTALVQMLGRGQGKDKYVGSFTLITTQSLYDSVKKYIEDSEEIFFDWLEAFIQSFE